MSIGSIRSIEEEDRRLDRRVNKESVAGTTGRVKKNTSKAVAGPTDRDARCERRLDRRAEEQEVSIGSIRKKKTYVSIGSTS